MKLRSLVLAVCSVAVLAFTVQAADEVNLDGIKCAMNKNAAAKASKFVEYKGGKVFFCCDNCPKAFSKKVKTDKTVAAKGNHQLVATKQVEQKSCPFSGGAAKSDKTVKVAGAEIAFCCENCQGKAKKMSAQEQLVALFSDDAFKKAGFAIKKKEFTSEGADDPNKVVEKEDAETTSEGADDPNKVDEKADPETKSEGADDPNS